MYIQHCAVIRLVLEVQVHHCQVHAPRRSSSCHTNSSVRGCVQHIHPVCYHQTEAVLTSGRNWATRHSSSLYSNLVLQADSQYCLCGVQICGCLQPWAFFGSLNDIIIIIIHHSFALNIVLFQYVNQNHRLLHSESWMRQASLLILRLSLIYHELRITGRLSLEPFLRYI